MANTSSRLYINKQQVAFIIHPKQTNKHPNINKKCREIVKIRNQTISHLHPYLSEAFLSEALFSSKRLKSSSNADETSGLTSLQLSHQ